MFKVMIKFWFKRISAMIILAFLSSSVSGCYILNFFKKDHESDGGGDTFSGTVAGQSLGDRAGGLDEAALALVYGETTEHAPAAIRPDPDTYVRQLLKQYREPGAIIARQIGNVEQFRLLLGGATEDFSKPPQETYDATSLLTMYAVAQQICIGLVAPNPWEHEGWATILPYPASQEESNIQWLAQRFLGQHSSTVDSAKISALMDILSAEEDFLEYDYGSYAKYVPVCATLALDAEALLL
jgi:hypothetical protein